MAASHAPRLGASVARRIEARKRAPAYGAQLLGFLQRRASRHEHGLLAARLRQRAQQRVHIDGEAHRRLETLRALHLIAPATAQLAAGVAVEGGEADAAVILE